MATDQDNRAPGLFREGTATEFSKIFQIQIFLKQVRAQISPLGQQKNRSFWNKP